MMSVLRCVYLLGLLIAVAAGASLRDEGVVDIEAAEDNKLEVSRDTEQQPNQLEQRPNKSEQQPDQSEQSLDQSEQRLDSTERRPEQSEQRPDQSEQISDEPEQRSDRPEQPVNERFPHAVQFGSTCGGSIISPKWVLTAGHCAMSNFGYEVVAGTNNTWDGSGVQRDGKRMIIHPLFMVGPHFLNVEKYGIKQIAAKWDFLLIELEEPLPLDGKTIAAVTLNEEEDLPAGLKVGYAGYGAEEQGGYMRNEMHGMDLELISNEECAATLIEFDPRDMVCARGRPPRYDSACNGDSGSGLVDESGRLVGVASWVEGDAVECRNGATVVFSRVSAARDWIRDVTGI